MLFGEPDGYFSRTALGWLKDADVGLDAGTGFDAGTAAVHVERAAGADTGFGRVLSPAAAVLRRAVVRRQAS